MYYSHPVGHASSAPKERERQTTPVIRVVSSVPIRVKVCRRCHVKGNFFFFVFRDCSLHPVQGVPTTSSKPRKQSHKKKANRISTAKVLEQNSWRVTDWLLTACIGGQDPFIPRKDRNPIYCRLARQHT